jgi:two-component system response regulator ChvI
MQMLQLLVGRAGLAVSFAELHRTVRPHGFHVGDGPEGYRSNVRTYIKRIRHGVPSSVDPSFDQIENQNGFGYRWRR